MSCRVTPRSEDNKGAGRWLTDGTECRDEDIEGQPHLLLNSLNVDLKSNESNCVDACS